MNKPTSEEDGRKDQSLDYIRAHYFDKGWGELSTMHEQWLKEIRNRFSVSKLGTLKNNILNSVIKDEADNTIRAAYADLDRIDDDDS